MIGWQFAQTPNGWEWQRLYEDRQFDLCRGRVFPSLVQCLADARAAGYSMSVPAGNGVLKRPFGH